MSFISSFPFKTPRDSQVALCEHLDRNTRSKALIHIAPTGVGKSAQAITVARHSGSAYIISPNRSHVGQYEKEYPELCVGRSANDHRCVAGGDCATTAKDAKKYCDDCPYVIERQKYIEGPISVSTIAYLIARVNYPVQDFPMRQREWVIIDEIHKLEEDLIRHCGLSIRSKDCEKLFIPPIPVPPAPENTRSKGKFKETTRRDQEGNVLIPYVKDILLPAVRQHIEVLSKIPETSSNYLDAQMELERFTSLAERIPLYFGLKPSEIVAWVELDPLGTVTSIQAKPLSVAYLYKQLIEPMGQRVLGLSATIPVSSLLVNRLGLPPAAPGEKSICRVPSPFPPENHKVHYINCGLMTYEEQDETVENMIPVIGEILKYHQGQRGIIHGHTSALSKRLRNEFGDRLVLAASSGADVFKHSEALKNHKLTKDSVLISPSMVEGVDLKGDDSVFQIMIKVPYLPIYDPWIAAHRSGKNGNLWYSSQTASIIIQALGRSLRTDDDTCTSYILDGSFEKFFRGRVYDSDFWNRDLFPEPLRSILQDAIDNPELPGFLLAA